MCAFNELRDSAAKGKQWHRKKEQERRIHGIRVDPSRWCNNEGRGLNDLFFWDGLAQSATREAMSSAL